MVLVYPCKGRASPRGDRWPKQKPEFQEGEEEKGGRGKGKEQGSAAPWRLKGRDRFMAFSAVAGKASTSTGRQKSEKGRSQNEEETYEQQLVDFRGRVANVPKQPASMNGAWGPSSARSKAADPLHHFRSSQEMSGNQRPATARAASPIDW